MKHFLKEIIYIQLFLLLMTSVFAQHEIFHVEDAVGKVSGNETSEYFKRIDAVKNFDKTKVAFLKKCLAAQLKIFYSEPLLNPPRGFNARTSFSISSDPFEKTISFPACGFHFDFYYLEKEGKTGGVKVSMDGTSIGMETNSAQHFFRQVGNFWKDCFDVKFPLFFEQLPITDSTADYIQFDFRNYGYAHIAPNEPFRIIKRNSQPLFIPLSRKEFLQFLIAKKEYRIQEDKKSIADLQKNIKGGQETLKNAPSYLNESTKKALADGNETMGKNIVRTQEEIKNFQTKIQEYETMITAMSPHEAASPARIDENKKIPDFDELKRLVPLDGREGVCLYKINPGYYDRSAPAAQLITIYYSLPSPTVFEKTQLNYLEKKTLDIFNHLDYQALKMSMQ
jgi:hypothetical protein